MSCLSSPPASLFFSLATSCHSLALVHCRASRSLFLDPFAKTCCVFRASGLRWAPHAWSIPSLWSAQSCNATGSTSWELPRKIPGKVLKPQSHDASERTSYALDIDLQSRPLSVPFMLTMQDQDTNSQIATPMFVENSVDTLIGILHTQAFVENQIEDSREHTRLPLLLP